MDLRRTAGFDPSAVTDDRLTLVSATRAFYSQIGGVEALISIG